MDEFKPEDELKPDPSDRRTGRSRQSSERSERTERGEPQINFDDIELDDTDDRRPTLCAWMYCMTSPAWSTVSGIKSGQNNHPGRWKAD